MTELIFGRDSDTKTEYLLSEINRALEDKKRVVIIVPEQQAVWWDDLCARRIDEKYALRVEVVSFTRLADSVFRTVGGAAKHYIGNEEKTLVMWNALRSVSDRLSVYGSVDREDRHVPALRRAVSELKLYSATPQSLQDAADRLPDRFSSLKQRLSDLSLIYAAYDEMLHMSYDDPEEVADALCEKLDGDGASFFDGTEVFLDSFHTLTQPEMRVMRRIISLCESVHITISMDDRDRTLPHFGYVWEFVKELVRLSDVCGSEVRRTRCGSKKSDAVKYISEKLWDYSAPAFEGDVSGICVFECADIHDEAVLCAARIRELCAAGASYSDIGVVAADFSSRLGICDKTLERFGIPAYVSGRSSAGSLAAVRLLLSACSVAAGGWKRDDIIACADSGLCPVSPDCRNALESYTEIWDIHGRRAFTDPDGWSMNWGGYTARHTARGDMLQGLANEAREALIPPLEAFSESFGKSAVEICTAAYKLLCDFDVYETLKEKTARYEAAGDFDMAQRCAAQWDVVCGILDTIAEVIPDAVLDAPRFALIVRRLAEASGVGTIPSGLDCVTIGSAGSVKLAGVRHLIVLGARGGEFPAPATDSGFFSDADRAALTECGLNLAPGSGERLGENMFRFWHTVSSPSETLTLIIPAGGDGTVTPSSGAARCISLVPGARRADLSHADGMEAIRKYGTASRAEKEEVPLCADGDRVSKECADSLFGGSMYMDQSRIECFNDCAFKYYCRYVLGLDEGDTASIGASDAGNLLHGVFERFLKEACENGEEFPMSRETIINKSERLVREYALDVCPQGAGSRAKYLFARLERSAASDMWELSEEFAHSKFRPVGFEMKIGSDLVPPYTVKIDENNSMNISGVVDRLDIYKNGDTVYLRVADYKTGQKTFRMDDVESGRNVQLMLYLAALCDSPGDCAFRKAAAPNGEKLVPAGAMYFVCVPKASSMKASPDEADFGNADVVRSGVFLKDEGVMRAMDDELSGRFLPVKYVKSTDSYSPRGSSVLADPDTMTEIKDMMCRSLANLGKRVLSGDGRSIPSSGTHSPCTWCAAAPICRHGVRKAVEKGDESVE